MSITHCRVCGRPTSLTGSCPSHPLPMPGSDLTREMAEAGLTVVRQSEIRDLRARVARLEGALGDLLDRQRAHLDLGGMGSHWVGLTEAYDRARALLDEARARGAVGEGA